MKQQNEIKGKDMKMPRIIKTTRNVSLNWSRYYEHFADLTSVNHMMNIPLQKLTERIMRQFLSSNLNIFL